MENGLDKYKFGSGETTSLRTKSLRVLAREP
jgi:hypothetical protein